MKNTELLSLILKETNKLITSKEYKEAYSIGNSFSRNRKLSFSNAVHFICSVLRKSISSEISNFIEDYKYLKFPSITKQAFSLWMSFLSGVFFYFGCFSLICIPCVLGRTSFQFMMTIWLILCVVLCGFSIKFHYKKYVYRIKENLKVQVNVLQMIVIFVVVICLLLLIYFVVRSPYMGWDTAYYSKVVENAINDNYMFVPHDYPMPYRYALSSYYMQAAVNAKLFGLHHLTTLKFVMGGLGCIYSIGIILFILKLVVKKFFYIAGCVVMWVAGIFAFNGMYNQAGFLLYRAYEAKAWCANIIVPLIIMLGFLLWSKNEKYQYRKLIILIAGTADVISMSSLIVIPAAILCIFVPLLIVDRSRQDIKTMLISLGLSCGYLLFFMYMT